MSDMIVVFLQLSVVFVFFMISVFLLKKKFTKILNPISLIIFWWCFWLVLTIKSPIGLFPISTVTIFYVLLFLGSILVGALLVQNRPFQQAQQTYNKPNRSNVILLILIVFSLPIFYGLVINFSKMLNPIEYSLLVRGQDGLFRAIFGSEFLGNFITMFSMAVVFASLVIGAQQKSHYSRNILLAFSVLALLVYTLVSLERFGLLMIIYVVLFTRICSYWLGDTLLSKRFLIFFTTVLVMIVISSLMRTGGGMLELINKYILMYHTAGFSILDYNLNNNYDPLEGDIYFGTLNLGFFDRLFFIVSKMVSDTPYISSTLLMNEKLSAFVIIGVTENGESIKANAFSTLLLPLVLDGGPIFIMLVGLLLGAVITHFYFKMVSSSKLSEKFNARVMLVFLLYAAIASIYQGVFSSQFFWGSILFYLFTRNRFVIRKTRFTFV